MKYQVVSLSECFAIRRYGGYPVVSVWHRKGAEELACEICDMMNKKQDARPVRKAKSPAQDTKEICHTTPNSRVTQGAEAAHIAEAATS